LFSIEARKTREKTPFGRNFSRILPKNA